MVTFTSVLTGKVASVDGLNGTHEASSTTLPETTGEATLEGYLGFLGMVGSAVASALAAPRVPASEIPVFQNARVAFQTGAPPRSIRIVKRSSLPSFGWRG